jgi:anti-sigma regulatory factor (Ser/Thr protein kinase)
MLRHRSVRLRIIVLVLVPVVALIGLYGLVLTLTMGSYISLRQAERVRGEVQDPVSAVQLQVSKERLLALDYLADPTNPELGKLLAQESKSDNAITAFTNIATTVLAQGSGSEQHAVTAWSHQLGTLRDLRGTVVSLGLSRAAAASSYSAIVSGGNNVLNQSILPLLATPGVIQANNLVIMDESLQAVSEEGDLLSADLLAGSYPVADQQLMNQLIVQHKDLWDQATTSLDNEYRSYFTKDIPAAAATKLASLEDQISTGPHSAMRIRQQIWTSTNVAYDTGFLKALRGAANALRAHAVSQARGLILRLIAIGGIGLLAIIAAIIVATILSRGLLAELNELRISALDLSSERLPAVLTRLRAGELVQVESETPQLEAGQDLNEIGQLRQAINFAARTAIGAAVDEVAIRRGVNDVFRNLARRNQSLLTRQLELLDAMERRVHDPEELADLFRVDHLTTRMRRHAEGLLIVAGGSSGRVWREPVPIVDVMRAAVAEIEDYTRIRVTARSGASVAGHAVADIIHLLAELVENATTFSPANTPVRIESDNVAKGLIVEIEDRGLGMSQEQIEQINSKLIDPPLLDLSGSEQLGLFIAGQLAARHDVHITMRGSAYGGIIAVVLIPTALVIDAGYDEPPTVVGIRELGGRPVPQLPGPPPLTEEDILASLPGSVTTAEQIPAAAAAAWAPSTAASEVADLAMAAFADIEVADSTRADGYDSPSLPGTRTGAAESPMLILGPPADSFDEFDLTASPPAGHPATGHPATGHPGTGHPATGHPATGHPVSDPAPGDAALSDPVASQPAAAFGMADYPTESGSFTANVSAVPWGSGSDAFDLPRRTPSGSDGAFLPGQDTPAAGQPGLRADRDGGSVGWPDYATAAGSQTGWLNLNTGPIRANDEALAQRDDFLTGGSNGWPDASAGLADVAAELAGAPALPKRQPQSPELSFGSGGDAEQNQPQLPAEIAGLPTRVRQASLAPQLREPNLPAEAHQYVAAPDMPELPPRPAEPSPEAARNLLSALQRGWERGRSEADELDGDQS